MTTAALARARTLLARYGVQHELSAYTILRDLRKSPTTANIRRYIEGRVGMVGQTMVSGESPGRVVIDTQ